MTEEFDSAADQLQDEASAARAREAEDRSESGPEPELPTTLASGADDDDNPHAGLDDGAIEVRQSIIARQWLDGMMPHEVFHLLPHIFVEVVRRVTGSRWIANDPQASSYLQTMVLMALTRYRDETIHQYPTVLTVKASPPLVEVEVGDTFHDPGGHTLMDWGDDLLPRVVTDVAKEVYGSSCQLQADMIFRTIHHLEARAYNLLALEKRHQEQQRRQAEGGCYFGVVDTPEARCEGTDISDEAIEDSVREIQDLVDAPEEPAPSKRYTALVVRDLIVKTPCSAMIGGIPARSPEEARAMAEEAARRLPEPPIEIDDDAEKGWSIGDPLDPELGPLEIVEVFEEAAADREE